MKTNKMSKKEAAIPPEHGKKSITRTDIFPIDISSNVCDYFAFGTLDAFALAFSEIENG